MRRDIRDVLKVQDHFFDIIELAEKFDYYAIFFSVVEPSAGDIRVRYEKQRKGHIEHSLVYRCGNDIRCEIRFEEDRYIGDSNVDVRIFSEMPYDVYAAFFRQSKQHVCTFYKSTDELGFLSLDSTEEEYFQKSLLLDLPFSLEEYKAMIRHTQSMKYNMVDHYSVDHLLSFSQEQYDGLIDCLLDLKKQLQEMKR